MQFIQLGKKLANILLLLSLTFLLIVFSILVTIPILLLLLYRKIISKYALHCRKDLSKILTSGAHIFAVDDVKNNPSVNVIVIATFKGSLPLEDLRKIVQERIITLKSKSTSEENPNQDNLLYPELRQYYHQWMGFLFWKWDTNFKLENHIRYYDYDENHNHHIIPKPNNKDRDTHISFEDLSKIKSNLMKRGWKESQSPWELLVIPDHQTVQDKIENCNGNNGVNMNYDYDYGYACKNVEMCNLIQEKQAQFKPNEINIENGNVRTSNCGTVLIFRFHHGLGDGLGFFNLLWNRLTEQDKEQEPSEKTDDFQTKLKKALTQRRSLLYYLSLPFRIHYEYAKQLRESNDENEWKVGEDNLTGVVRSSVTKKIPMETLMEIRRTFKVSFSGLIMSLLSGALRKSMISCNIDINDVPNAIHALLPIPSRYEDNGKLRNHITYIYPALSLGNHDLRSRLNACETDLNYLKYSTVPLVNGLVHRLAGSFPVPVIKGLHKNVFATVLISNFPGPMQKICMLGQPMTDVMFGTSCHGNNGICISIISYDSDFRISIEVDDGVLKCDNENKDKNINLAEVIAANIECELKDFFNYCDKGDSFA